ncbi:hypothetical protein GH5_03364 [Leishmania sp. Ghana 2012 LV757]|uniref:hypothetical protein n=1 Tax=Leishmania sp. Ghana 2012 LV757 TaxID=2803181 RepID=UPI001B43660A|nr:hypothetical protein GH5_03364 [Leishmania sp. Ghana 2012 LV757]
MSSAAASASLTSSGGAAVSTAMDGVPVEVASMFYTGINEPRPTAMHFSFDGLHFVSAHTDDAVRLIDVGNMMSTDVITCDAFGVHNVRYTHSSSVVCVAPRFHLDGHLHLLNTETSQFFGEMAYLNDTEPEIPPVASTPVYSTLSQCPATDVIGAVVAAKGRLALFHPLISGCIAATPERSIVGTRACVQFSCDGHRIAIGDDHRIAVFDRRNLFQPPLVLLENKRVFTASTSPTRCKGVEFSANASRLLLTSSSGEVVVYDWQRDETVTNYFHGAARRHFLGSADAIGAQHVFPYQAASPILQLTSSMTGGRHLLVYAGCPSNTGNATQQGRLLYELQSKDSDVPVAVAVNPRLQLVATAARSITWWAFHSSVVEAYANSSEACTMTADGGGG